MGNVAPVIMAHADAALMEHPITRKAEEESFHGWLDYGSVNNFSHINKWRECVK